MQQRLAAGSTPARHVAATTRTTSSASPTSGRATEWEFPLPVAPSWLGVHGSTARLIQQSSRTFSGVALANIAHAGAQ
ncbi:MAG: hypothetical protein VB140_01160 [Burkholderia sp.]